MKKYLLIFITMALPILLSAQVQTWKNDPAHSRMGFTIKHLAVSEVAGFFSDFETTVTYSKADYSDMNVQVTAKIASINTGIEMRDNHLKTADFFDAEKFPEMTFTSTKVEKIDDNNAKLFGNLTLHGVTKAVELHITYNGTVTNPMNNQEVAGFKVTGVINRKDFGMGMGFADNFVGDNVNIIVDAEFNPAQ